MAGKPNDSGHARTVLECLLWSADHTYEEMAALFETEARKLGVQATITPRHLRRLASDQRSGTTPATRRVFQSMFGQSMDVLLSQWADDTGPPTDELVSIATSALENKEMLTMAAERARKFTLSASASNLTAETVDQLHADVASLAVAYQHQPMTEFLPDLVETQDTLFTFLEGRQAPALTGHLLLLARA